MLEQTYWKEINLENKKELLKAIIPACCHSPAGKDEKEG